MEAKYTIHTHFVGTEGIEPFLDTDTPVTVRIIHPKVSDGLTQPSVSDLSINCFNLTGTPDELMRQTLINAGAIVSMAAKHSKEEAKALLVRFNVKL